jgi:hypothetical protein
MRWEFAFLLFALLACQVIRASDFDRDLIPDQIEIQYGFSTNGYAADHLLGWWQMDDTQELNVKDRSPHHLHGRLENFAHDPFVEGLFHQGLFFSGNSIVDFSPRDISAPFRNGFTISVWYRGSSTNEFTTLVRWRDDAQNSWELAVGDQGIAQFQFSNEFTVQTVRGSQETLNVNDQEWHHIAGTYHVDSKIGTIYVDGYPEAKLALLGWEPHNTQSLTFNKTNLIKNKSQFLLDEVRLFDIGLPQEAISQLPPTYGDPDLDGLANIDEMQLGTNPFDPDTDKDGLLDGNDASPNSFMSLSVQNGLRLWLRADQGVIANSSGEIVLWSDQSGNGHDAFQSEQRSRPRLIPATTSQIPSLSFDGIDDFLQFTPLDTPQFTVILVYQMLTHKGWGGPLANREPGKAGFQITSGTDHPNILIPHLVIYDGFEEIDNVQPAKPIALPFGPSIQSWSSDLHFFDSGIEDSLVDRNGGWNLPGGTIGFSWDYIAGNISEVIIYDRILSDKERVAVENDLRQKYNSIVQGLRYPVRTNPSLR